MASIFYNGALRSASCSLLPRLCKVPREHNVVQVAFMKRVSLRENLPKPPPFQYWEQHLRWWHVLFQKILWRYDENSKLIVVDGPPAAGKTKLCEKIAEEFNMLYMPPPTHEEIYITTSGFDLRSLDPQLPPACRSFVLEDFLANPNHRRSACFQLNFLYMRLEQYMNAILHMWSTGQGVVLNRSAYSDIAFAEAMKQAGYISKDVMTEYMQNRTDALALLLRPHLMIYLDIPPERTKDRIRKRGNTHEVNSKVFSTQYLSDIDKTYKQKCLPELKEHSYLLAYDWPEDPVISDVILDIEALNLDIKDDVKLADWDVNFPSDAYDKIDFYQDRSSLVTTLFGNYRILPPELLITKEEDDAVEEILERLDGKRYPYGLFNRLRERDEYFKLYEPNKPMLNLFRASPRDFINRDKQLS